MIRNLRDVFVTIPRVGAGHRRSLGEDGVSTIRTRAPSVAGRDRCLAGAVKATNPDFRYQMTASSGILRCGMVPWDGTLVKWPVTREDCHRAGRPDRSALYVFRQRPELSYRRRFHRVVVSAAHARMSDSRKRASVLAVRRRNHMDLLDVGANTGSGEVETRLDRSQQAVAENRFLPRSTG